MVKSYYLLIIKKKIDSSKKQRIKKNLIENSSWLIENIVPDYRILDYSIELHLPMNILVI